MIRKDLCKRRAIVLKAIQRRDLIKYTFYQRRRDLIYLQLLFCVTSCSICVDTPVYRNLASQLTLEECRKLVASLYYTNYEFPTAFNEYFVGSSSPRPVSITDKISKDDFCLHLLTEWDKRSDNTTHVHIERRLRQMNKIELADWLGKTVFHQLATDINDTLLRNPFADSNEELALNFKLLEDKPLLQVNDKLTPFDFALRLLVIVLFVVLVVVCWRIVRLSYATRNNQNRVEEEMKNLLDNENRDDS